MTSLSSRDAGYTLLEMLVVLGIIGLLGIAFNTAVGHQKNAQSTRDIARQIAALARSTMAKAIASGRQSALHVDIRSRTVSSDASSRRIYIPASLEISMKVAQKLVEKDRVGSIAFFPDGSSSGGEVSLQSQNSRPYTIRVFWLTGEVSAQAAP